MEFNLKHYLSEISKHALEFDATKFDSAVSLIKKTKDENGKIIIIGNGGSAAIAAHASVDFTKACNIRSVCFNESSLLTCFSNDYGHENAFSKAIEFFYGKNDTIILISSSGKSHNILNASNTVKRLNLNLITFSGFSIDNPLKTKGDVNFWVNSTGYNIVENTHQIWLLAFVDYFAGSSYYKA